MPETKPSHGKAEIIPFEDIARNHTMPPAPDAETSLSHDETAGGVIISLTEVRIQQSEGDKLPSYQRLSERFRDAVTRLEGLNKAVDICSTLEDIANAAQLLEKHPEFRPDLPVWRLVSTIKKSADQSVIMNRISNYPSLVRLLGWAIRGECRHPAVEELGRNTLTLVCQCQYNARWDFTTGEVYELE